MRKWWHSRRFDLFDLMEVCVAVVLAVVVAWSLGVTRPRVSWTERSIEEDVRSLARTYGPQRYSENAEEWIIRDFFKDRREAFFVDVGANHYRLGSTTYYLESRLGWSGIAVEPQRSFQADYAKHRKNTRFFPFFAADVSDSAATLYMADRTTAVASSERDFTEQFGSKVSAVKVPTIALSDLLDRLRITRVDFLSIDVELSEPRVLAGFDIDRFNPALVCIEAHPTVRQQILNYFATHGYVLCGRYLRADIQNLYFAPLGSSGQAGKAAS
jgi:FkbM family methyltransferase